MVFFPRGHNDQLTLGGSRSVDVFFPDRSRTAARPCVAVEQMVNQMADNPAVLESMVAQNPALQQAMQVCIDNLFISLGVRT